MALLQSKRSYVILLGSLLLLLIFSTVYKGNASKTTEQDAAVRGVWLTNVASDALFSRENIEQAVATCAASGINTIFVVTWNRAFTLYPSNTLQDVTGASIHPDFEGRDPLKEVIEAAHKRNIKVIAWFEFGFSCAYEDPTGGPIIEAKPHWASKDIEGNLTEKNNFQWMNAFHPEVQDFVKSLVREVVENYDVDGIQGDDRLPALPSNGGYDDFTVGLYKDAHNGESPPENHQDYAWVKWRSALLTTFLQDMVEELRAVDNELIISMSPSIYPWSEENYLQDWPSWMNLGLVDLIVPQVYRYNFEAYKKEMDKIVNGQLSEENLKKFIPGVLLQVDDYNPDDVLLKQMVDYNRDLGVEGEVFFFYEGIKKRKSYFQGPYTERTADEK